jgi:hypothetical protein
MPSRLIGLMRQLTWDEFRGNPTQKELAELQQIAANAAGKTVGMAGTHSDFTVNFGGGRPDDPVLTPVPGSSPPAFALADTVVATVTFDGARSWKRIAPLTLRGEGFLLDHEQGHYDITALMARDCFIDLMQLKAQTFASPQAGQTAARDIVRRYKSRVGPIQDKYDGDTTNGAWFVPSRLPERKESFQTKWEGFILRARGEERQPPAGGVAEGSPVDGVRYKVRLLDVLAGGGFTF